MNRDSVAAFLNTVKKKVLEALSRSLIVDKSPLFIANYLVGSMIAQIYIVKNIFRN